MSVIPGFGGGDFPDWYHTAPCRGLDHIFMVTDEDSNPLRGGGRRAVIAEAKAICKTCPNIVECGEIGIAEGDFGIWGGMSQSELRNLKKEMRNANRS